MASVLDIMGALGGGGGILSAVGSVLGGFGARRRASLIRRETRRLLKWSRETAGAERKEFELGADYRGALDFYRQLAAGGYAADAYRAAMESRGLAYGGAPTAGEAIYTGAARAGAYQGLLALGQLPLDIEAKAWQLRYAQSGLQQGVASMYGPSALEVAGQALASFVQGGLGGAQAAIGAIGLRKLLG